MAQQIPLNVGERSASGPRRRRATSLRLCGSS